MSIAVGFWTSLIVIALVVVLIAGIIDEQVRKNHRGKHVTDQTILSR
jgi:hypothetical protein